MEGPRPPSRWARQVAAFLDGLRAMPNRAEMQASREASTPVAAMTNMQTNAALAGSSELGDYCTMGGKSAVADHITVCNHVRLAACSGVTKHITQCGDYAGLPAQPAQAWRREIASLRAMAAGRGPGRRLESECEVVTLVDDIS